jgi:hypothetical protein
MKSVAVGWQKKIASLYFASLAGVHVYCVYELQNYFPVL